MKVETDYLARAGELVGEFSGSLPEEVSAGALGVWSKLPYKAMVVREALIWRTEDLARNAHKALLHGDAASGALLTRGVMESAALVHRLAGIVRQRASKTSSEMDALLMSMLLGSKTAAFMPNPVNILTLIDRLEVASPSYREMYDDLSEIAHPNFDGVARLFSTIHRAELRTTFATPAREKAEKIEIALVIAMETFKSGYNDLANLCQAWVSELPTLDGPEPARG